MKHDLQKECALGLAEFIYDRQMELDPDFNYQNIWFPDVCKAWADHVVSLERFSETAKKLKETLQKWRCSDQDLCITKKEEDLITVFDRTKNE